MATCSSVTKACDESGTRQHTPVFALQCHIVDRPFVRQASRPTSGLTVTGLIVLPLIPFVVQHTSLVCVGPLGGDRGTKRRVSIGNNEGAGTCDQQWITRIMVQTKKCCGNYSAMLCVYVSVCCGSGTEHIALLAATLATVKG